ncbi:hypothetical protein [Streptomyces sp. NPDC001450]
MWHTVSGLSLQGEEPLRRLRLVCEDELSYDLTWTVARTAS